MGKTANIYFTQSGCLTLEGLERYKSRDLQENDRLNIKSHLATCEMCSDALEGIGLLSNKADLENTIAEINQNLMEKFPKEKSESRTLKPSEKFFYYSAAASILILFGVLFYLNFSAHKLSLSTGDNITEQNPELPTPPIPLVVKGKNTVMPTKAKKQYPKKATGEKLQHITVNFSDIKDEDFFDEELEISDDEIKKTSNQKSKNNESIGPEGFLMDMVVISEASAKSGPSPMEQHLQVSDVDDTGKESDKKPKEAIFTIVETMPQFPGGEVGLRNYLQENLNFPAKARKAGIQGKVYVSFVVNSSGKVSNALVIKGIGNGCDEKALHVINTMPFWKPATQQGRPVSVRFVLPVYFKLN